MVETEDKYTPLPGEMLRRNPSSNDMDARRLENAVWRLWRKERSGSIDGTPTYASKGPTQDWQGENISFVHKVKDAIGDEVDFVTIRFPQNERECDYDDLPTFPIRPNFANFKNKLRPASECVVFDGCPEDPYHPSNTPIYQTATFVQPSASEFGAYDYTRSGNPTRTALEKHVAMLEQAAAAFAFASGMAALHTMTRLLRAGDELIANEDIYGGMHRLLTQDAVYSGIQVTFVDTTDIEAVARAITPRTKLIHTESPSNPRMRISDLRKLAALAHKHDILLSVDSTMMPPVICKPLTLGVDIVVHSATKFFSGHADCTGGLVCIKDPEVAKRVAFLQNAEGTALAPFECFLFLRGIKTMHLRVERAQENAQQVAAFLKQHCCVRELFFPGVGGCDPRSLAIHQSQCTGSGAVLSFTTGSVKFSQRLIDACRIFKTTVSFGSVNSLGEMPCTMSHASIPSEKRTLPEDLIRLSIGIEDVRDLLADLAHAFEVAEDADEPQRTKERGYDSRFEDLPIVPKIPGAVLEPELKQKEPIAAPKGILKQQMPKAEAAAPKERMPSQVQPNDSDSSEPERELETASKEERNLQRDLSKRPATAALAIGAIVLALWTARTRGGR